MVGGGTDLPAYANKYGGAVVNLTINKYIYIAVNKKFDDRIRVSYSKTENVEEWHEVDHDLVRACLELAKVKNGIEIVSMADIPGQGSGLGSSSSFTVGLLMALWQHQGLYKHHITTPIVEREKVLAKAACKVEIKMCGKTIGKQDQYAAAYGGLNYMEFTKDKVTVAPIPMNADNMRYLSDHLMLFYLGVAPPSVKVLSDQNKKISLGGAALEMMHKMKATATEVAHHLGEGKFNFLGEYLHENWVLKRQVSSKISNSHIGKLYQRALRAGIIGGKVCGAGGGGFMLFFAPPEKHDAIKAALPLKYLSIAPEMQGAHVVHMSGLDD